MCASDMGVLSLCFINLHMVAHFVTCKCDLVSMALGAASYGARWRNLALSVCWVVDVL